MEFGEIIDEACERAGLDPAALEARHITSIRRSMTLLNTDLEQEGATAEFRERTYDTSIVANAGAITLPDDAIDVLNVQISDGQTGSAKINVAREHRDSWSMLADPTTPGQPTMYWLSKADPREEKILAIHNDVVRSTSVTNGWGDDGFSEGSFGGSALASLSTAQMEAIVPSGAPLLVMWPVADRAYSLTISYFRQHADPTFLGDDVDAPRNWLPTLCAGLAAKIAQKYALDRYPMLQAEYQTLLLQRQAEQNSHPVFIGFRGFGHPRRRRH